MLSFHNPMVNDEKSFMLLMIHMIICIIEIIIIEIEKLFFFPHQLFKYLMHLCLPMKKKPITMILYYGYVMELNDTSF